MIQRLPKLRMLRMPGIAFLCAFGLTLLIPAVASAHTIIAGGLPPLASSAANAGVLDGGVCFNLVMITLVELGAIFWVGAQLWINFVLEPATEKHAEEKDLNQQMSQRFERRFSLPTLLLLLLTNLGVLYGQVLTQSSNNWATAFSFSLLREQATSGRFGTYWLMRMIVLLLALIVALYTILSTQRPQAIKQTLPLLNLFLGAMLFIALTMSGDAANVTSVLLPYSVVADWLHLLAVAMWVGGMFYILLVYLPVLKTHPLQERTRSLLAVLPHYSTLAIIGVVLMATTGPLDTTFHLASINQFFTTAYGRALVVKVLLVCALLATSAYHVFWLRPRLKKEYLKYTYASQHLATMETSQQSVNAASDTPDEPLGTRRVTREVKLREERLAKKTTLLTRILSWEPWLGAAVILCVGLMSIFAGTLTATSATSPSNNVPTAVAKPFNGIAKTSDGKYTVTLNVNPNRFGTNIFTVEVKDTQTGQALTSNEVSVTAFVTMLDMAMGTDSVSLPPNAKGGFSASEDLVMSGNWGIQIQLRTPDNILHEAIFKLTTPF